MAKRTKNSNAGIVASNQCTTLEVDENLKPVEDGDLDGLLDDGEEKKEEKISEILPRLTVEMKEKLDKFNELEKHCVELEQANSKLTDSVNAYLEEIEALKSKKSTEGAEDLKKELELSKKETADMRRELNDLRDENDNYLVKISELTFENAKLTSQLQEVEKTMTMSSTPTHGSSRICPSTGTVKNQPKYTNPYLQNGYQDW